MEEPKETPQPEGEEPGEMEPESGPGPGKETADGTGPEQEILLLKATLEEKTEEIRAMKDKYLREVAEMENHKKRLARDMMDQLQYANENILKELLPVLDNLDRAITHMKTAPELADWVEGVDLTYKQCIDLLKKFGVSPIPSVGELFDPSRHQAVTYLDTNDQPENHVAEELQKGYLFHERVLRPSMVAVARKPNSTEPEQEKINEQDK